MIVLIDKEKLQKDMALKGYTMTELANKVGCSKASISAIVGHKRSPSAKIAVKICEQLESNFEDYFFIEPVHKKKQTEIRR